MINFAIGVKRLRDVRNLSMEDLAERIGWNGDSIMQIEDGVSIPDKWEAERLAEALEVPVCILHQFLTCEGGQSEFLCPAILKLF